MTRNPAGWRALAAIVVSAFAWMWVVAEVSPAAIGAVAPVPSPSVGPSARPKTAADIISHLLKLEDPFRKPLLTQGPVYRQSPLETAGVDTFKLMAVVTGPYEPYAMIAGGNGETFFVKATTKVGLRKGMVTRILPDRVIVTEQITNLLGQVEFLDSEIRMAAEKSNKLSDAKIGGVRVEPELLPSPGAAPPPSVPQ